MAAGRHGGYRDYELRDSETELGMARKESRYPKGDYRNKNGVSEHEMGLGGGRDSVGYRGRGKEKDFKGRGVINGEFRSTSSRSNSGSSSSGEPRRCAFVASTLDREPGELSSDGSDGAIDSETQVNYKEKEAIKIGNGVQFSPLNNKKRKFSPIVWDRDDKKEVVIASRSKNTRETANLPPPHPPSIRSNQQLSNSSPTPDVNLKPSLLDDSEVRISEASPSKIDIVPNLPELPVEASSLLSVEEPMADNLETGTTYDDDYVPMRTIISSRWANDEDSPADEGEISDDENSRKLKRKSGAESAEVRGRKSITPDFTDVKRDGSDRNKGRYTGSDERLRSSSRDSSYDKNDHMEIDDERNHENASIDQSDSEYEDDHSSPEPAQPPRRSVNMLQGCRSVDEFAKLDKIDEGTYGVVYRAKDKKTGEIVALKKVKMEKEREGFPMTSLREINILLSFHHPSIVDVKEVVMGDINSIFMVMEYMETDLKALMEKKKQPFSQSEVKCLMLQLLGGTKYLHDNWVLHRDLKTSNLLLNNCGELKICDFGLARQYGSPLKPYTQLVVTLWYRAPELLLGAKQYSTAIDMWSLGCIMAELLLKEPLFNGKSEIDQLDKIFRVLGTPTEAIWPGCTKLPSYKVNFVKQQYNLLRKKFPPTSFIGTPVLSDAGFDLLNKLLTYDPDKRITAGEALNHEWFREVPLPKTKELMPTFLPQHAQARRGRRVMQSPDPLEQQRRRELRQQELGGTGGLFGQ